MTVLAFSSKNHTTDIELPWWEWHGRSPISSYSHLFNLQYMLYWLQMKTLKFLCI